MLSFDALIEQAKSREMPPTKIRGILREYLQILILKEIYKIDAGKKLYFTGGTYLRLVHSLKRFSEDLDFNSTALSKNEFESLQKKVIIELKRLGLDARLEFSHWGNIYVSKLVFPKVESFYNVKSKYSKKEGIIIKVETNNSKWPINSESQMISGFGEFYPCLCTERGILFADKIDALLKKNRGRHLYDIIFMLSNKYPINNDFLKHLGLTQKPMQTIIDKVKSIEESELTKQAQILRPFLFDESQADLLINSHQIIPQLIAKYKN